MLIGEWYQMGGKVYICTNKGGTIERFGKVQWWRILFLFILNAFGEATHIDDVRGYLGNGLRWFRREP